MTEAEILALVDRLDPEARVTFRNGMGPTVFPSEEMTSDGFEELIREVPGARIVFGMTTQMWDELAAAMRAARPNGPSYELDDLEEDGTWKPGRRPFGWGDRP